LFLLTFVSIYGGMHLYLFLKVRGACKGEVITLVATGAFCALMVGAPIFVRMLERRGFLWPARVFAYVGYTWMAVILWFFVLGIVAELWNLCVRAVALLRPGAAGLYLAPRPMLAVAGAMILVASVWGVVEASHIRLVEKRLRTERLSPGSAAIRIVLISDLHLGLTVGKGRLKRIIRVIERAQPDVLLCAGDLADFRFENAREMAALLAAVRPPLGKFAVMGNHEFYGGVDDSIKFHQAAGFRLLRQESVFLNGRLRIVGVDDPAGIRTQQDCFLDEDAVLPSEPDRGFTVLLKHRSQVIETSLGRFDLQLSGHTHGGQIFPFGALVHRVHQSRPGLHRLEKSSVLYVTRGTGTWGPPLRLLAPPEVTLFVVEPSAS